jgi:hypothetical protein
MNNEGDDGFGQLVLLAILGLVLVGIIIGVLGTLAFILVFRI